MGSLKRLRLVSFKYMHNTFQKLIVLFALLTLSSCGVFKDSLVLSETPENRKLGFVPTDTIVVKTPFYFGVISPKGYDRFEGNVFENLRFESMAILTQEYYEKEPLIYRRILHRKPFKLVYELQTIVGQKRQTLLTKEQPVGKLGLEILTDSSFVEKQKLLESPAVIKAKEPLPIGTETLVKAKKKKESSDVPSSERVTIISCIAKENFSQDNLDKFRKESPVPVDYYLTDTWARIFVRDADHGGMSLEEAQRLFPGSWRVLYGK